MPRKALPRRPGNLRVGIFLPTLLLATLACSACASTTRLAEFEAFAAAGGRYTEALGEVLDLSADALVDGNSERLIQSRELAPVAREELRSQDEAVRANLAELELVRRQLEALGNYFEALEDVATSDADEVFGARLEASVGALQELSAEVRRTPLFRDDAAAASLAGGVGELIVRRVRVRALEEQLERHKRTIGESLLLQEALLEVLRAQAEADLGFLRRRRYEQLVEAPFLTSGPLPSKWAERRRSLLRQSPTIEQIEQAKMAARAVGQAWRKLLARRLTAADLAALAAEIEPILDDLGRVTGESGS